MEPIHTLCGLRDKNTGFFPSEHDGFIRCVSGMKQDSSFISAFQTSLLSEECQTVMLSHCKSDPVAKFLCVRNFC